MFHLLGEDKLQMTDINEIRQNPIARRDFLLRMGAAGLGASALALLQGCGGGSKDTISFDSANFPGIPGRSADEVVLNFALTLEILEADLYRQALNLASGRPLSAPLDPTLPASGSTGAYSLAVGSGSINAKFTQAAFLYLVQYAYVEAAHRDFLQTALLSMNAPLVVANQKGYTAPLGNDLGSILTTLYAVEEEGTKAYLGAAGFMNDPTLLTTAVAIHSTEHRHSAAIAYVLGKDPGPVYASGDKRVTDGAAAPNPAPYSENTFGYYRDPKTVLNDVQPFIVK